MTADTQTQEAGSGWKSQQEWQDLEAEQREEIFERKRAEQPVDSQPAGAAGEAEEFAEMEQEELTDAYARIQAKAQDTWEAVVLGDVKLEFWELRERHVSLLKRMAGLFTSIQGAESADDLDEEALEQMQEADEQLEGLLEELTVDERFDLEFWQEGDYPADLKLEVFRALFAHYQEAGEQTDQFR